MVQLGLPCYQQVALTRKGVHSFDLRMAKTTITTARLGLELYSNQCAFADPAGRLSQVATFPSPSAAPQTSCPQTSSSSMLSLLVTYPARLCWA